MATKENEAKKDFLKRYEVLLRREQEIEQEIAEIRSRYTGRAITYSDMPKGTEQHDLSDYVAEAGLLFSTLDEVRRNLYRQYRAISDSIESMQTDDEREKELLRLKYLRGYTWEEVAVIMNYDIRHIFRIHGNALLNFHVIECQ